MDALPRQTSAREVDGEVVWFWRPDAGVKLVTVLTRCTDDGDNQAGLREEHEISRKTIRAGNAGDGR